jgi:hypothetical protein
VARKPPAPKGRKLKVFRTAIGFHDAYVAAPSRKAALAAWGSDADLFARGVAEEVDDPALTAEPLTRPGEVIRRARGTTDEFFAALPKTSPHARPARGDDEPAETPPQPRKPKPRPPPSRAALDAAEASIDAAVSRFKRTAADLARREQALAKERQALEASHQRDIATLEQTRDTERRAYERALVQQG